MLWRWRPAQVQERQGDQMPDLIPGDLRVTLRQLPHPIFRRNGDHLHMRLDLTLTEVRRIGRQRKLPSGANKSSHAVLATVGIDRRCWASSARSRISMGTCSPWSALRSLSRVRDIDARGPHDDPP